MNSILRYRWRGLKSKSSEMFFLDFLWWSDCYIFNRWYVFLVVTDILWNETFCLNIHPNRGWPETMRKLCLSTKFPHLEIRWNYGVFFVCFFFLYKSIRYFTQWFVLSLFHPIQGTPLPNFEFLKFFQWGWDSHSPIKNLEEYPYCNCW